MKIKTYSKFSEIPIRNIEPMGWIKNYLKNQKNGLTGNMEKAGYPFNTVGWKGKIKLKFTEEEKEKNKGYNIETVWWPYEQVAYWIDGMIRCGYLLKDKTLIKKAEAHTNYVLNHPDKTGYLGPVHLKKENVENYWIHAVFFRALMAQFYRYNDKNILRKLKKHYLTGTKNTSFQREVCNIETISWLYGQTGDKKLLKKALDIYKNFTKKFPKRPTNIKNLLSDKKPYEHGVTYNEESKLPAILYMYTGRKKYLEASIKAYKKIDKYFMLVDGVNSSSEFLEGKKPLDSHETCDITDFTWSLGYLLMATGNPEYADKIEKACFNAAPGAVKNDFTALQYFSCPNQVIAASNSSHNRDTKGMEFMAYWPNFTPACCPGQVNRIMPNYAARMWMLDKKNNVTAMLYGPSKINFTFKKTPVTIIEDTNYPFSDKINFKILTKKKIKFSFILRIPGWSKNAAIYINNEKQKNRLKPGTFVKINRTFSNNDTITLSIPMSLKTSKWGETGIAIEYGPLVFALPIKEKWKKFTKTNKLMEDSTLNFWEVKPKGKWNYAITLNRKIPLEKQIKIIKREHSEYPWQIGNPPIILKVPVKKIKNWKLIKTNKVLRGNKKVWKLKEIKGKFIFTPDLPDKKELKKNISGKTKYITLIPYGATHLRLSIFPSFTDEMQ